MKLYLSDDGENWYNVASWADDKKSAYNKDATRMEMSFDFEKDYAARFICFRVENGSVFIDELEAFNYEEYKANGFKVNKLGDYEIKLETKPE